MCCSLAIIYLAIPAEWRSRSHHGHPFPLIMMDFLLIFKRIKFLMLSHGRSLMWYMDAGSNVRQFITQFYYLLALLTGPGSLPSPRLAALTCYNHLQSYSSFDYGLSTLNRLIAYKVRHLEEGLLLFTDPVKNGGRGQGQGQELRKSLKKSMWKCLLIIYLIRS